MKFTNLLSQLKHVCANVSPVHHVKENDSTIMVIRHYEHYMADPIHVGRDDHGNGMV